MAPMHRISIRDLARETKEKINLVQKGETLVVTLRGEPVAVLADLPDDIALRVLPFDHPRVEAILRLASTRRGKGVPADKVISEFRKVLSMVRHVRPVSPALRSRVRMRIGGRGT